MTTDAQGNWVVVWNSCCDPRVNFGTDWDILFSRSADNGATWTHPSVLNTTARSDSRGDYGARIATDGEGVWIAVWTLGASTGTDADIAVARSKDNGRHWTEPTPLNAHAATDADADVAPQIATDGLGNWVAVWQSYFDFDGPIDEKGDILSSRSTDNGETWSDPVIVSADGHFESGDDDFDPQLATDGQGNWVSVWVAQGSSFPFGFDRDILVSRSVDNGASWTLPLPLHAASYGEDLGPEVTSDGAGNCVVVWQSTDSLGGMIGNDWDILVTRSADSGASWSAPVPLNSNAFEDEPGLYGDSDVDPRVATDGAGNWVVVWTSLGDLGGTIGFGWNVLLSWSTDHGATWSAPRHLNANTGSDRDGAWNPSVASDLRGTWVAVWDSDYGAAERDFDIFASRFRLTDCNGNDTPDECEGIANFDEECTVDLHDWQAFMACLAGPSITTAPAACDQLNFTIADLDNDVDVDLQDAAQFQTTFSGPQSFHRR